MNRYILSFLLFLCAIVSTAISEGTIDRKLRLHGVDKSVQRAISGMTKSGRSHNNIVSNIQHHFPEKSRSEINDIVIASNIKTKSHQARGVIKKAKNGKR